VRMFLCMCSWNNYILSLIQTPLYFLKLVSHFSILRFFSPFFPNFIFIRAWFRSVTMTFKSSWHHNKLRTLCNAQTKLSSFSDVKKANDAMQVFQ
jgi:hypothetical protein